MNLVLLVATLALRVVLTFDDGYRDHALIAAPELEKRGWRGTFNVVTGLVGGGEYLSWEDVRDLNRRGHEVATHTVGHPNLVALLEEGKTNEVRRQLVESRDQIVARAGFAPRYLCPPFNKRNDVTDRICGEESLCPMRIPRCNFGGRNPKDVRDVVTNALARGVRRLDLLHHGISAADHGGWCPFPDRAAFVRHLDRIAELEREGLIVVTDYEGCASEYPLDSRAWPHHADGACCASGGMSEAEAEEVAFQHAFIRNHGLAPKVEEKFSRNRHPDAQWYPKAGLGLFIHWGLSSVTGWGDLSWGMIKPSKDGNGKNVERWGLPSPARSVPPNEYWKQIRGFDASKFDPDRILAAAKKAGFEYAILTTKHHEGFCLWPSAVGDMTTKNHLNGRDLVGEFAAACRRQGLKVCFYYSPPDWYFERDYMSFSRDPDIPDAGCDWEPRKHKEKTPAFEAAYREYNRVQIEELLTRYGKVDMLWFDGMGSDCVSVKRLRELQPGIIINDRGRSYGDVFTQNSECKFPRERRPRGCWWEYIHTLCDGGWGYRYHECYKPVAWLISETGRARSWNGNFVANVCPNAHGELPDVYYKIMDEMAAWMKANGRVLKEAEGTDLWPEHCNVAVTRTGKVHHFLYDWLQTGDIVCDRFPKPKSVTVGGTPIPYEWKDGTLKISIPYLKIGNLTTVVDVTVD